MTVVLFWSKSKPITFDLGFPLFEWFWFNSTTVVTLTYINDTVYKHGYLVCIWYGLWMQYSESSTSSKAVHLEYKGWNPFWSSWLFRFTCCFGQPLMPVIFEFCYHWQDKQQSQVQSNGALISSSHPSIWNLVKQNWCKFRGLWLHSTNVVFRLNYFPKCCRTLVVFIW